MAYNDRQLDIIDQRVRSARADELRMGSVTERDPDSTSAMVTMDDSSVAVPVKVFGDCPAAAGDRVGLVKLGSEWVVFGTFTGVTTAPLGSANVQATLGSGTTSSGAWADIPGTPGFTFTKVKTDTVVRMALAVSAFVTTANVYAKWGFEFDPVGVGSTVDYEVAAHLYNAASVYHHASGFIRVADIAPGEYTVTGRWSRFSGSGTMNVDGNCQISMECTEELLAVSLG